MKNFQKFTNQQMQICSNNGLINEKDLRHLIKREFEFISSDQMDVLINSFSAKNEVNKELPFKTYSMIEIDKLFEKIL